MVKMVITDLDGTLLNDNSVLSSKNREAIIELKEKGIIFGIATGRSKESLDFILRKFQIDTYVDHIITYNGVIYHNPKNGQEYKEPFLDRVLITDIYRENKGLNAAFILFDGVNRYYSKTYKNSVIAREIDEYDKYSVDDFEAVMGDKYPKLMAVGEEHVLDEIEKRLVKYNTRVNYFRSLGNYLEIVSHGVSKGNMLKKLCDSEGISLQEVMAIGDNLNDVDMIKYAGIGVAVGNAHAAVKECADDITYSNEADGFAESCKKHIGGKNV